MNQDHSLSWYNFTEHLEQLFANLYKEESYADVTLVSSDQFEFKAHKIVLSACSPVLKKIIDDNPRYHPLRYQSKIQSQEMEAILHFMYIGVGKFYQHRMEEFIKAAKDLKIKHFCETKFHEHILSKQGGIKKQVKQRQPRKPISSDAKSTECPECGKVFSNKWNFLTHFRSVHQGIKYSCNQCDYQFTQQSNLQTHIQSRHEGIKYPCNQCDYQATERGNLQRHIQSKHEGIKYPCNHCDSEFTQQSSLQTHIQSVHGGIKYSCNQCDYQATQQGHLQTHIQRKHSKYLDF